MTPRLMALSMTDAPRPAARTHRGVAEARRLKGMFLAKTKTPPEWAKKELIVPPAGQIASVPKNKKEPPLAR
jgi:hypothetical protein